MRRPSFFHPHQRPRAHNTHADCVAVWTLRAMQHGDLWQQYTGTSCSADVLRAAGIEHKATRGPSRDWLKKRMQERYSELTARDMDLGGHAEAIATVGRALGLDDLDVQIVAFAFHHEIDSGLQTVMSDLQEGVERSSLAELLAVVLGVDCEQLLTAMRPSGALYATGVFDLAWPFDRGAHELPVLTRPLVAAIRSRPEEEADVLSRLIGAVEAGDLNMADFGHLGGPLTVAGRYLRQALKTKMSGVNILLHGPPGTGKTVLAGVLGRHAGATVYTVRDADSDGDEADRSERLQSYRLAQRLLGSRGGALIVFDEVEDVFGWSNPGTMMLARQRGSKAWLNRLLERNPTPAIWITNDAASMDPALLRRFDIALQLDRLTEQTRSRIARNMLSTVPISAATMNTIAADERITPADIERAAKVAVTAQGRRKGPVDEALMGLLEASLKVRHGPSARGYPHDEARFDIGLLNADSDPAELVRGLCRSRRGRIYMYGPPGTGKTAFAHHIGRRMGRPVLLKRASDLLDKYVGGTESKIAAMFDEAEEQRAVLLLDEADSFLRDRRDAQRAWEVTQVNELLVQMEAFEGVLLCATNLDASLDLASARRFDCHIRFDALASAARWRLFSRTVADAGHSVRTRSHLALRRQVDALEGLVLGDFQSVRRRAQLLGRSLDGLTLVGWLRELLRRRDGGQSRAVGFSLR